MARSGTSYLPAAPFEVAVQATKKMWDSNELSLNLDIEELIMRAKSILLFLIVLTGTKLAGQSPMPPALYTSSDAIESSLVGTDGDRPGMAVGRITNTDDYRINVIHRTAAAGAIVHEVGTELHYITAGAGTLVTGGVVVRPAGGGRATIEGGTAQRVTVGDAVLIPQGTPHWYSEVEESVTYLEVRF